MKKLSILILITCSTVSTLMAQSVGIGYEKFTPDNSAALEIQSTTKGILIPRLTSEEREAIVEPAEGLLVFQTDNKVGFYYHDGESWTSLNDAKYDTDTDPANEFQTMTLAENTLTLSNGNSVYFTSTDIQEYQTLELVADTLKISSANYVLIPQPDDLGNHTATQNIRTAGNYISSDGGSEGILIDTDGTVNIEGDFNVSGVVDLGANAIQASEIEANAVTTGKIANGQVTLIKMGSDVPLGIAYQGGWDANTNDPNLSSGNGANSDYYTVATAGTINLGNGVTDFAVGDWVIYNGSDWVKLNNAESSQAVASVFGRTGAIAAQDGDYSWGQITKTGSSIADIEDVTIGTPLTGQMLINDGTAWRNRTISGDVTFSSLGAASLSLGSVDLSHLHATAGSANTIMYWNGSAWRETVIENIEGDGDDTNELITNAALVGTELQITDAGQRHDVELSSLVSSASDDQNLKDLILSGTTLSLGIEDGDPVNVNLASLVDDADNDPTNEVITSMSLSGSNILSISENSNTETVNLSNLVDDADANPDNERISNMYTIGNMLYIAEGGSSTAFVNLTGVTSDRRLKENIAPTKYGLGVIMKLDVMDYDYISGNKDQVGLIAQDLYEIFPSAVRVGSDDIEKDPWRIDYSLVTPIIIKATQELNEKVSTLEESNKNLIEENNELKLKLEAMDSYEQKLKELEEKVDQFLNVK